MKFLIFSSELWQELFTSSCTTVVPLWLQLLLFHFKSKASVSMQLKVVHTTHAHQDAKAIPCPTMSLFASDTSLVNSFSCGSHQTRIPEIHPALWRWRWRARGRWSPSGWRIRPIALPQWKTIWRLGEFVHYLITSKLSPSFINRRWLKQWQQRRKRMLLAGQRQKQKDKFLSSFLFILPFFLLQKKNDKLLFSILLQWNGGKRGWWNWCKI